MVRQVVRTRGGLGYTINKVYDLVDGPDSYKCVVDDDGDVRPATDAYSPLYGFEWVQYGEPKPEPKPK